MKVLVSLFSAALLAAQPVFANDFEVYADPDAQAPEVVAEDVFEIDEGAMSVFDLQAVQSGTELFSLDPAKKDKGGKKDDRNNGGGFEGADLIGVIIGGIIGAIGAGNMEKDNRYKNRQVTCFAKNKRGNVFRAQGKRPRAVQTRAMDKCFRQSNWCRQLGCRAG